METKASNLLKFLSDRFSVEEYKILTKHKNTRASWARAVICAILNTDCISDFEIAKFIGIMPSLVPYYITRFEYLYRHNSDFKEVVDDAIEQYKLDR